MNPELIADKLLAESAALLNASRSVIAEPEALPNAELIVRAVNSHDALVAAVKAFLVFNADDLSNDARGLIAYNDALDKAEAAIATLEAK